MKLFENLEDLICNNNPMKVKPTKEKSAQEKPKGTRFLYVLQDSRGRIKVGITDDLTKRLKQIERAAGVSVNKIMTYQGSDSFYQIEQKTLKYFNYFRINDSEWLNNMISYEKVILYVEKQLYGYNSEGK